MSIDTSEIAAKPEQLTHAGIATIHDIVAAASFLTIETRKKLLDLGRKIRSYAKASGLETNKAIIENLDTQFQLQGKKLDTALIGRALKSLTDATTADKLGCFKAWAEATSDREAQVILNTASGKAEKKKSLQKSALEKCQALARELTIDELSVLAGNLEKMMQERAKMKKSA